MSRTITHRKGTIKASAEGSDDDFTIIFEKIRHITKKATLLIVKGEEVWIPFGQTVDAFLMDNKFLVTRWIAKTKGLI